MKPITKQKLHEAKQFADDNDKSTEWMIEYMQDYANVSFDCVMDYLDKYHFNEG
jgi:hypothetical protein